LAAIAGEFANIHLHHDDDETALLPTFAYLVVAESHTKDEYLILAETLISYSNPSHKVGCVKNSDRSQVSRLTGRSLLICVTFRWNSTFLLLKGGIPPLSR